MSADESDGRANRNLGALAAVGRQMDNRLNARSLRSGVRHLHLAVDHLVVGAGRRLHALLDPRTHIAERLLQRTLVADGARLGRHASGWRCAARGR